MPEQPFIVIADDLTGSCEIAGSAFRYGLTSAVTFNPVILATETNILACDTETRLLGGHAAAAKIKSTLKTLNLHQKTSRLFKKTDSLLRGPVFAELHAIATELGYSRVLLVPANPAMGRTVTSGYYHINGIPLHETEFAKDPHHPRKSTRIKQLLPVQESFPVTTLRPYAPLPKHGIIVGDASNTTHLQHWADCIDDSTLAAGSTAFFEFVFKKQTHNAHSQLPNTAPPPSWENKNTLLVSGTTSQCQKQTLSATGSTGQSLDNLTSQGIPDWSRHLQESLNTDGFAAAYLQATDTPDPANAPHISNAFAELTFQLVEENPALHLIIEGGTTAAAIADRLQLKNLHVIHEWSPGVVSLISKNHPQLLLTLKPGSYPWPPPLRNILFRPQQAIQHT